MDCASIAEQTLRRSNISVGDGGFCDGKRRLQCVEPLPLLGKHVTNGHRLPGNPIGLNRLQPTAGRSRLQTFN